MTSANRPERDPLPYPQEWERVADIRVLRAGADEWHRLASWSADMNRRGWKLLRVSTEHGELVAVFGRRREQSGG